MKDAPHTAIIQAVEAKIEEYHALAADFAKDVTLQTARDALAAAETAKERADIEDESIAPEDLVDRRIEAARAVEVAKIRLARAEKAHEEGMSNLTIPLRSAREVLAGALREAAEVMQANVEGGARRVFGDMFDRISSDVKSLLWSMGERYYGTARRLEGQFSSVPEHAIAELNQAVALLQDAYRDR